MSAHTLVADQPVVAGDDLHLDAEALRAGRSTTPASSFGRSANVRNPTSVESRLVARGRAWRRPSRRGRRRRPPGTPRRTAPLQRVVRRGGHVVAPGEHRLRRALDDHQGTAVGVVDQDRGQLAIVVERHDAPSPVAGDGGRHRPAGAGDRGRPQGLVERVAPDGPVDRRVASLHTRPEHEWRGPRPADGSSDRAKVILPSVSVPVLSVNRISMFPRSSMATSRLTSTFLAARAREPGGQAHGHDGRHHLGGDAHGDGQGEEQRLDQRPRQRDVDDEDEDGQHGGDAEQEPREPRQPDLEGGLRLLLPQPGGDPAERRPRPGADDDAPGPSPGGRRAHEGAVRPGPRRLRGIATPSTDFATGNDSPVRTPSSHSQLGRRRGAGGRRGRSRRSGARRRRRAPGRPPATRTAAPSRTTSASWWILARSEAMAASARYSLTNPRPTLSDHDHGDDHARWCRRRSVPTPAPRRAAG